MSFRAPTTKHAKAIDGIAKFVSINLVALAGDTELRATFLGCDHIGSTKVLAWDASAGIKRGIAKYIAAVETVWSRFYSSHSGNERAA